MKKFFSIVVLLFVLGEQAFACVCAGEISSSFSALNNSVSATLNSHSEAIRANNIKQAKLTNKLLEKKLEQLAELIEKEKQEAVKRREIIFELRKKIELIG
ncbi:hypothetical protein BA917_08680 [Helicobacter pullorum]|uniref:Periplasmic protein n=1 Tax=Helicobacter pullorum TaxID=35818 RepID=A0A377Q4W9_9HELI|nr:hypothetical protein [Helicobacter pullorum]OCR18249.1 hypothetical protein BA917_08955 [Helicobacter pullorum]OCR18371.1 hypothetical protein BA917_08680 [Helicobacter pullorum]STQ88911.1 Uncharacterised protein [Helicobacter pullorum]